MALGPAFQGQDLLSQLKLPLQDNCVPKKMLQLVGVTAMFIASKYEEMYPPEIGDFAFVTNNTYTKHQIRQMEMKILRALNFGLGRPLPLHFLRRASKIAEVQGPGGPQAGALGIPQLDSR